MKNLITILAITILSWSYGQMAVVDAGVNASLSSQLATSSNQLLQLEKSYKVLQEASDKIDKVSSMVKSVNDIGEIVTLQKEAISNITFIMSKTKKENGSTAITKNLSKTLATITGQLNSINKTLSSGFFSMTDKDRIDYFENSRSIILLNVAKTRVAANKYR